MISKFSVKKPYTVLVGVILVIVLGVVSLTRMTADLLPNMSLPYAIVITTDPGASPKEVESRVTAPIEAAMATTSNIENISSMSYHNYSVVVLEYGQSTNMDSVMIEMRENLDQLEDVLGDSVGSPMIMQIDPNMMPVMVASADVDGLDSTQITDYVEDEIIPALESIEGVASVSATGKIEESIRVTLNQEKIDALNEKIHAAIDDQFVDQQKDIESAKSEISSGKKKLEEGQNTLADTIGSNSNELNNKKIELYQTEADLNAKLTDLQAQQGKVEGSIEELKKLKKSAKEVKENLETVNALLDTYSDEQLEAMGQDPKKLHKTQAKLQAALDEMNAQLTASAAQFQDLGITVKSVDDIPALISALESSLSQIKTGISSIQTGLASVGDGKTTLDQALNTLNQNMVLNSIQIASSSAELDAGEGKLDEAQESLEDAKESAYEASDANEIVSQDTVESLLAAQNFSMPAGYLTENQVEYLISVGDKLKDKGELESVVLMDIGMDGIEPIHLNDVADVKIVDNTAEVYAKVNGNPALMLSIEKQTGYSTGDVTDKVSDKFAVLEKENEALHLNILMDQGVYIDMIVDTVVQDMIFGAILAIVILLLFLKDIRPTFVIACSIPLSVVVAIVLMYFTGITLNVISLSGLSLGIGMLVDNSIVVIENIYRLRSEGESIKRAAVEGAKQVTGAIAASTLTTVCVFAPIIFTTGITRQLFVDMALTIAYSLFASLVVALAFVPMMSAGVLKKTKEKKHPIFDRVQDGYAKLLSGVLHVKILVFLVVAGLFAGSIYLSFSRGTSFMPTMSSTQMTVTVTPNEKVKFEELTAMSDEVLERISDISGIRTIGAMAGGNSTMSMMGSSSDDTVTMYVLLEEETDRTNAEIADEITEKTQGMDCEVKADSSMMDMEALTGNGISIQVRGNDLDKLRSMAKDVAGIVEQTKGTTEILDGLDDTTPEFKIKVDKEKAVKYGMTVAQVYQLIYGKMAESDTATQVSTDLKEYSVSVDTKEQEEMTREDLKKITFTYKDKEGNTSDIPLTDICTFEETNSLNIINRDGQERYITVSASIEEGYNVGLVSQEVQRQLDSYKCQEGYSIVMAGENEAINDALNQVVLMLILAVIFIYLIMVAQFQSLLAPFIIMFTIPLAFTGGFFALYFTGSEVSVIAMIGFVMLAGIIVNNGIVMVDYINQLRRGGMEKKDAIVEAGRTRLRPILMTALTTILAMSTMALGIGSGSEMMQPMAIVTIGGLVYGTLLTLLVVPSLYDAFHRNKSMVEEEI